MSNQDVAMMDEWVMWTAAVRTLRDVNIDVDDEALGSRIAEAFALWGEALVALRVLQDPEVRADALEAAEMKYNAGRIGV